MVHSCCNQVSLSAQTPAEMCVFSFSCVCVCLIVQTVAITMPALNLLNCPDLICIAPCRVSSLIIGYAYIIMTKEIAKNDLETDRQWQRESEGD